MTTNTAPGFIEFIKTEDITFKHAKEQRDIIGKEFHSFHEIFFLLSGNAEFISDSGKLELFPNTLVTIPKETFHQFIEKDVNDYYRCVFSFGDIEEFDELIKSKMGRAYSTTISEEMRHLLDKLIAAKHKNLTDCEQQILIKSIFGQLLLELPYSAEAQEASPNFHPLVHSAINYIHAHIQENIQISDIATQLHVSSSYLMHIFKRNLHISIYKYIIEKKLILAKQAIKMGMPPMQAAALYGFHEYSGFYKMYKKMFDCSPSNDKVS